MAKATAFLGLVLPAFNEFYNSWYVPMNANFTKIDTFASDFGQEMIDARGSVATLSDRLDVTLNDDGTIKSIPEIDEAKSSTVYGYGTGSTFQTLDMRLELGDLETFAARQGYASLMDTLAWINAGNGSDCLVSGPTNPLTFSGAIVTLNGATTNVVSNINGYKALTEINDALTISGASATYYLKLNRNASGAIYYTIPAGQGSVGSVSGVNTKFIAAGENFISSGVKPGHILEITAPSGNLNIGKWVVYQTSVENGSLANNEVIIIGTFPSSGSGLDARFIRAQAPTMSFTATPHAKSFQSSTDTIYIGRVVFDGANITSLTPYAYQGKYADWQQVTLVSGDFSYTLSHNIGYIPKSVQIYASQANDFSQPLELLSAAKMTTGSASVTSGDQTLTYTAPALRRSVITQITDTTISIKNATNGIFYEDFSGVAQTSGYLYVVVER